LLATLIGVSASLGILLEIQIGSIVKQSLYSVFLPVPRIQSASAQTKGVTSHDASEF
jgi:hypothetical protein